MTAAFADPEHERVLDLMRYGYSQQAASLHVFAGEPLPAPAGPGGWREWVRASLATRLPWLQLESGASDSLVVWLGCLVILAFWLAVAMLGRLW